MTRTFFTVLALCAGLSAWPAHSAPPDATASDATVQGLSFDAATGQFTEVPPPDGGWQAFAALLEKAAPDTNTAIPLSPSQLTSRIAHIIDTGHAQDALTLINQREHALASAQPLGDDVQLMYQKGRAFSALGQHDQAIALWQSMTESFPELPEPWNALAVEYAGQGQLQLARNALNMALSSDPAFAPALENLGHVQMALAQEAFAKARASQGAD